MKKAVIVSIVICLLLVICFGGNYILMSGFRTIKIFDNHVISMYATKNAILTEFGSQMQTKHQQSDQYDEYACDAINLCGNPAEAVFFFTLRNNRLTRFDASICVDTKEDAERIKQEIELYIIEQYSGAPNCLFEKTMLPDGIRFHVGNLITYYISSGKFLGNDRWNVEVTVFYKDGR